MFQGGHEASLRWKPGEGRGGVNHVQTEAPAEDERAVSTLTVTQTWLHARTHARLPAAAFQLSEDHGRNAVVGTEQREEDEEEDR